MPTLKQNLMRAASSELGQAAINMAPTALYYKNREPDGERAQERSIAAVAASYVYGDFVANSDGQVSVGHDNNEYFFYKHLSTDDQYVFVTKAVPPKVMIASRGTSTWAEARDTVPTIVMSAENMQYNPLSSYFSSRVAKMDKLLAHLRPKEVVFTGHSLGGTTSRVFHTTFKDKYNSRGYAFNPGSGILTNRHTNKMARDFVNDHVDKAILWVAGKAVDWIMPHLGEEGTSLATQIAVSLSRSAAQNIIDDFTDERKFDPDGFELHRMDGDVISAMGATGRNSFWYENNGWFYDVVSNHDMEAMHNKVKWANDQKELTVKGDIMPFQVSEKTYAEMQRRAHIDYMEPGSSLQQGFEAFVDESRFAYLDFVNKFN